MNEARLALHTYWFPTKVSVERQAPMRYEYVINIPLERDKRPSMAEIVWATGDIEHAMAQMPDFVPSNMRRIVRRLLRPWPEGRHTHAYRRTGGILNMFTPPWGKAEDIVWTAMLSQWKATDYADKAEQQAALRDLEQMWNITPHPFFAGLTPAQVMVGGGAKEYTLAREFIEYLTQQLEGQSFFSEGKALIKTLSLLRSWELQPRADGRTPRDIILVERTMLLERRAQVLGETE